MISQANEIAARLGGVFENIHANEMAGLPLLNPKIDVEALEFQEFEGRTIGIIITPWLMSLIMLPSEQLGDDWTKYEIGHQHIHTFPSGDYKFLANHFDGIGVCQLHAIHSPMSGFFSHEHAIAAARQFMSKLFKKVDEDDRLDERRLERFINNEEMGDIRDSELASAEEPASAIAQEPRPKSQIARRDFLRGNLAGKEQA